MTGGSIMGGEVFELAGGGLSASVLAYGATLQTLRVPDAGGRIADVVLGYDRTDAGRPAPGYLGATVGRYGNRIAGGRFTLDGRAYALACNDGPNTLHGGCRGFDMSLWQKMAQGDDFVDLRLVSPDGEEGFPGTLTLDITYRLVDGGLHLDYRATTDAPTVLNVTSHAYFNLAGEASGESVTAHRLEMIGGHYLPVDATLIPTGEIADVAGTPFDFRRPRAIGEALARRDDRQIAIGGGIDHCYCLPGGVTKAPRLAARLTDPRSGRRMEVLTTEPGVQVYTANFFNGGEFSKSGLAYLKHQGICFECQHYPDSPNRPAFPSTRLAPGEIWRQTTIYRFSAI